MTTQKSTPDDHFALVKRGLALHEARKYSRALPYFEKALAACPRCPNAIYNKANTLIMLGDYEQARALLLELVGATEDELRAGCPDMAETPRSLCLDAFNILFTSTLYATGSWKKATPFLREHLRRRARGLQSRWSRHQIIQDADELREEYAPRAKPVRNWVV